MGSDHLALNIDATDNGLDLNTAFQAGDYFSLNEKQRDAIIKEMSAGIREWHSLAKELKIPRAEQELMGAAFRI